MKTLNDFIEEAAKKRCPEGQYWCYTDKKCKRIPKGWHVMRSGYLARDYEEKKKNGNGNGPITGMEMGMAILAMVMVGMATVMVAAMVED